MKRLPRTLLNAASVVSLVLGIATLAIWVRSFWYRDIAGYTSVFWSAYLISDGGAVALSVSRSTAGTPPLNVGWSFDSTRGTISLENAFRHETVGFAWPSGTGQNDQWWIPDWLPVVAFLLLPTTRALHRRLPSRRAVDNVCSMCGYDLRATPDRCPECGTSVVSP